MYYTIEGKRFLGILYVAGLIVGSVFINLSLKMNLFRVSDFLGFIEYIKTLQGVDSSAFFSYVFLVRLRQLMIFFLCIFLFSPYVVFCILDFLISVIFGTFVSVLVIKYGWIGMINSLGFLVPHYLFYGAMLCVIYIYLFRRTPLSQVYRMNAMNHMSLLKDRKMLEYRIMVVVFCLLMFGAGCYTEAYINPELLKIIF